MGGYSSFTRLPTGVENGSVNASTGVSSVFSAWTPLISSLIGNMIDLELSGTVQEGSGALTTLDFEIGQGAPGLEVRIGTVQSRLPANALVPLLKSVVLFVPKGSRIVYRSRVGVAVASILNFGWDIYEY